VFDPADSNILYAGTAGHGVFKTVDGGANWRQINDGLLTLDVSILSVSAGKPTTVYAATKSGVFALRE
jgi:hypothetical protein